MDKVSNEYAQLAQLEMDKIRAAIEKIDGKKMVSSGTYNSSEFAKKMNKEVIKVEKKLAKIVIYQKMIRNKFINTMLLY